MPGKLPPQLIETSLPWGGRTVGDAADFSTLNDEELMYYLSALAGNDNPRRHGVLYNTHSSYSGNLAASNPAGTTARVATGAALAWRFLYLNDANVDFSCPTKGYYHIVLRCNRLLQTVRLVRLGHNTQSYPAPVRSDDINDLSIALVYSSGSTLTIKDTRRFFRNIVITGRYSDSESWCTHSASQRWPVVGTSIVCGSHPPEALSSGEYSGYNCVRSWNNGDDPLIFLQALGNENDPTATQLVYRDIITGGAWYAPKMNYTLNGIDEISAVMYFAIGPIGLLRSD